MFNQFVLKGLDMSKQAQTSDNVVSFNNGTYGGRRPSAKDMGRKIRSGTGVMGTAKRSASSKKK